MKIIDQTIFLTTYIQTGFDFVKSYKKLGYHRGLVRNWMGAKIKDVYFEDEKLYTFAEARHAVEKLGFIYIKPPEYYKTRKVYTFRHRKKYLELYIYFRFDEVKVNDILRYDKYEILKWKQLMYKAKYFKDHPECLFKEALDFAKHLRYSGNTKIKNKENRIRENIVIQQREWLKEYIKTGFNSDESCRRLGFSKHRAKNWGLSKRKYEYFQCYDPCTFKEAKYNVKKLGFTNIIDNDIKLEHSCPLYKK